jgi:hypothetical protein
VLRLLRVGEDQVEGFLPEQLAHAKSAAEDIRV